MTAVALSLWLVVGFLVALHLLRAWDVSPSELATLSAGLGIVGLVGSALLRALPSRLALLAVLALLALVPLVLYDFYRGLAAYLASRAQSPSAVSDAPPRRGQALVRMATVGLVLFAAFFRLAHLGYSEFQGDEARAMLLARALVERRDASLLLWHKKGPIEVLLPAAVLQLGNPGEAAARLPFAFAGLAAVLALASLGRRMWSARAGWLAGLVLAIDGTMIAFSRIVQYQSVVVLFAVLAMWCAWRFHRGGPHAGRYLLFAGLFLGLGTWAHYEMVLAWPPVAWLAFAGWRHQAGSSRRAFLGLASAVALAGLVTAAFYVPFVRHPQFAATGSYIWGRRLGGDLPYNQLSDYLQRASFYNASYYVVAVMGTLLVALGCQLAWLIAGRGRSEGLPSGRGRSHQVAAMGWLLAATWMAAALGTVAREAWFEYAGRSWAIVVYACPLAATLLASRHSVAWRATLLWFAGPFCAAAFLAAKPHTHFYTMMPAAALLCGWAWDRALAWLEAEQRLGAFHARVGAGLVAGAGLGLFTVHQYVVFVRHDPEYKRVYPQARLPIWTPFGDQPPRGGYFGFPYRAGWNALRRLGDPLAADYDSNEERLVTGWYTWGAVRCAERPARYYLAWRPQDAEPVPLDVIQAEYRRAAVVCVRGAGKLTAWQRSAMASESGPAKPDLPDLWLDDPALPGGPRACGSAAPDACPEPETASGFRAPLACPESSGSASRARAVDDWRSRSLAVMQALELPLPQVAYRVQLAEGIGLWGADFPGARAVEWDGGRVLVRLHPGDQLGVVLVWRAAAIPRANYSVFVHLQRAGVVVAQHDGWPDCGRSPTSTWQSGQLVFDGHFLRAKEAASATGGEGGFAAGEYKLLAGIYEPASGRRLAVESGPASGLGAIELATVAVMEP